MSSSVVSACDGVRGREAVSCVVGSGPDAESPEPPPRLIPSCFTTNSSTFRRVLSSRGLSAAMIIVMAETPSSASVVINILSPLIAAQRHHSNELISDMIPDGATIERLKLHVVIFMLAGCRTQTAPRKPGSAILAAVAQRFDLPMADRGLPSAR